MKKIITKLSATSTLFLFLLVFSGSAQAVTVCANGCDVTTIQDALDSDFNGQDIFVGEGTYNEGSLNIRSRSLIAMTPNRPDLTIIDATGIFDGFRQADVLDIEDATIRGFTLRGGKAGVRTEGAILNNTKIVLDNLIIEDNESVTENTDSGGVIVQWGSLEIINSIIRDNRGGGVVFRVVQSFDGTTPELIISNSEITDTLNGIGLSIRSPGGQITIRDTMIANNSHGGVSMQNPPGPSDTAIATTLIEDTIIQNNKRNGGMTLRDNVTLNNVTVLNNIADGNGGGIFLAKEGNLVITGGSIEGNQAGFKGGGIFLDGLLSQLSSSASITNNTALEGIAGTSGGGIRCQAENDVELLPGSVTGNNPDDVSCNTTDRPPDTSPPPDSDIRWDVIGVDLDLVVCKNKTNGQKARIDTGVPASGSCGDLGLTWDPGDNIQVKAVGIVADDPEEAGGSVTGIIANLLVCKNRSTDPQEKVRIEDPSASWNWGDAGLPLAPGERVQWKAKGPAK